MTHIPTVTGSQMAEIDALMMNRVGVNTFQLMELAGYGVAHAIRQRPDMREPRTVLALAGTGGNGGDAMVAARLLSGWGYRCTVILARPRDAFTDIAAHQLAALDALEIPVLEPKDATIFPEADLIIDGLLGFSLRGNPRGETARLISLANAATAPLVAIDIPSGVNADTGDIVEPCIVANQTVTLGLPKTGLMAADESITGSIVVADIGVPPFVYNMIGVDVDSGIFALRTLVPVR